MSACDPDVNIGHLETGHTFCLRDRGLIEAVKNLAYSIQVGNDSGNGSETDKFKTVRLEARYDMNPGIAVEASRASTAGPALRRTSAPPSRSVAMM